jgi:hypothetical protein
MSASFDMTQFMTQLPDYLEGDGKNEESIGNAVTTLLEVSDFIQFREMMLCTKRNMDEGIIILLISNNSNNSNINTSTY